MNGIIKMTAKDDIQAPKDDKYESTLQNDDNNKYYDEGTSVQWSWY